MFEPIIITLKRPICRCKVKNLGWTLTRNGIQVECETCGTTLDMKKLSAYIKLEIEYPESKKENNIIKLVK